jgi:RNA polymerase sigma-70 factor, ECF subfamily
MYRADMKDLEALLSAARDGDSEAWKVLIPQLYPKLRQYFIQRKFNACEAVELSQRTITAVMQRLPGFQPEKTLSAWVFGIARNLGRSEVKARIREERLGELASQMIRTPTSPTKAIYAAQVSEILAEEIQKLATHHRLVIEHDLEDGDDEQFAKQHGLSVATVRTRRHRALKKLKQRVEARLNPPTRRPHEPEVLTPHTP